MTQKVLADMQIKKLEAVLERAQQKALIYEQVVWGSGGVLTTGAVALTAIIVAGGPIVVAYATLGLAVGGLISLAAANRAETRQRRIGQRIESVIDIYKQRAVAPPKALPAPPPQAAPDFSAAMKRALDMPVTSAASMTLRRNTKGPATL